MKKYQITCSREDIEFLTDRIKSVVNGCYKLADKYQSQDLIEATLEIRAKIYFLEGMNSVLKSMLISPDKVYTRLKDEIAVVEDSINRVVRKDICHAAKI